MVQPVSRRRGLGGFVDKAICPEEDDRDTIFQASRQQGCEIFFRHLRIRADGGLNKSGLDKALFSLSRLFSATMAVCFVLFNFYTITANWFVLLSKSSDAIHGRGEMSDFMILLDRKAPNASLYFWVMQFGIAGFEVLAMLTFLTYSIYVALKYTCCISSQSLKQYRIWHQIYSVCCELIPMMTNFSAMKSLQSFNPQIIGSRLSLAMTRVEEGQSHTHVVVSFALKTLLFGSLGFMAFVLKFAQLVESLQKEIDSDVIYGPTIVFTQVSLLFGFINQAFGITQISQVETARLFLFIFGGEDSKMQAGELDRQETFLACVARTICEDLYVELPSGQRKLRRTVAILTFTHLDVQSLVLDEDETQEVDAGTLRSGS